MSNTHQPSQPQNDASQIGRTTGVPVYIAVDLDRTLAIYDGWKGPEHIGDPIPAMVQIVRQHLNLGHTVYIFTARVSTEDHTPEEVKASTKAIQAWCLKHIGEYLPVTAVKHPKFSMFYDDRAISVIPNTGITLDTLLGDLLNVIHHDGGITSNLEGLVKASIDAQKAHMILWQKCIDLQRENAQLKKAPHVYVAT